jgi:hypothetical protein
VEDAHTALRIAGQIGNGTRGAADLLSRRLDAGCSEQGVDIARLMMNDARCSDRRERD